jgi:anaerobic selenocysteine-containing dehydrogenase
MARHGVVAEWLRWVVLIASGSLDSATGMQFHRGQIRPARRRKARTPDAGPQTRPELPRVIGQLPAVALVDEIEAGNIRALFVTGGNPLTAFPQPARLRAALASLDVLAVVDVAENALTALATHVLPATGQLERADITLAEPTALEPRVQATGPVVAPVIERRPVWWMFAALNRALGRADVDLDQSDEQYLRGILRHSPLDADALFAAGPHGVHTPLEPGWVHDELLADGRWNIAPAPLVARLASYTDPATAAFVIAPRREMAWSNSVAYGASPAVPVVRMHPDDASGGSVELATDHGRIITNVAADATVRAGVVSISHGHADENPGELTSETSDIDPLTAMPRASGLEVRVTPRPLT